MIAIQGARPWSAPPTVRAVPAPTNVRRTESTVRCERNWEGRAIGMAIALSKDRHYEWEDFRQGLKGSIAELESSHALDDARSDYHQRGLQALGRLLAAHAIVDSDELAARTAAMLEGLQTCATKAASDARAS